MLGTSGCSAFEAPPIEDVEVGVAGLRSPSVGFSEVSLPVVLDFRNTADSRVPDCSASFNALINSSDVARASTAVGTLGPGDTERTQLDVVIDFGRVGEQVVDALERGVFTLVLDGDLESDGLLANASREARVSYEVN